MDKKDCRKRLNLDPDTLYVLFNNGNSDPVKREDLAQDVVQELSKEIGESSSVELLVLRSVSPSQVVYYLNAADVLIITSDNEGSPNILKEAIACQVRIVSFDVGDTAFQLGRYSRGRIVERNVGEMVHTIKAIIAKEDFLVTDNESPAFFSEEKIAARIKEFYDKIMLSC